MPTATERRSRLAPATRVVLVVGLGLILLTGLGIGAATAAIYRSGTIRVDVRSDDGTDVAVRVPAGLAEMALTLVPGATLRTLADELGPLPDEVAEVWPAVRSSYRELEQADDFVLLDVRDGGERTRVQKRDGMLHVDHEGADGECHVAIPLDTVRAVLSKVEQAFPI